MDMNERRELIDKYKELWAEYVEENPDHGFLEGVLRQTCGFNSGFGDKKEKFPILAIPVTELEHPEYGKIDWRNYQHNGAIWAMMGVVAQKDDLAVFGTDCGKVPRAYKIFGERGLIELLAGFKIDFVFGCIRNDEDVDIAHVGIPLGAIAFQAGVRVGEAFAYMVNVYGGGLRYEDYKGWNVFEAE